ncbi:MAG: CopG family transcriptional regulator [Elusimicrobia bacterium]|nr:CopG family transcriptional regulator [Elusimicrobiota bacterium]
MTAAEFDRMADEGEDITPYLDLKHPIVTKVRRVNVDFPDWMVQRLDQEAVKLNISRQAVIKTWLRERLDPNHRMTR